MPQGSEQRALTVSRVLTVSTAPPGVVIDLLEATVAETQHRPLDVQPTALCKMTSTQSPNPASLEHMAGPADILREHLLCLPALRVRKTLLPWRS